MGVEYEQYLIPRPNDFLPSARQIMTLLHSLEEHRWICSPDSKAFRRMTFDSMTWYRYAERSGVCARLPTGYCEFPYPFDEAWLVEHLTNDLLLCWPVVNLADSDVRYPFKHHDPNLEEAYYRFQLHFSPDYVCRCSELIGLFESPVACQRCGQDLSYWKEPDIFHSSRIHYQCPACATRFDVSELQTTFRSGWTGEPSKLVGGVTYRFALCVDCGKCFPRRAGEAYLHSDLVAVMASVFGCSFYQAYNLH